MSHSQKWEWETEGGKCSWKTTFCLSLWCRNLTYINKWTLRGLKIINCLRHLTIHSHFCLSQSGDRRLFKTDVKRKLQAAVLKINSEAPPRLWTQHRHLYGNASNIVQCCSVCVFNMDTVLFRTSLVGFCVLENTHTVVYFFVCSNFKCLQWHKGYSRILATGKCGSIVLHGWHRPSRTETHTHAHVAVWM